MRKTLESNGRLAIVLLGPPGQDPAAPPTPQHPLLPQALVNESTQGTKAKDHGTKEAEFGIESRWLQCQGGGARLLERCALRCLVKGMVGNVVLGQALHQLLVQSPVDHYCVATRLGRVCSGSELGRAQVTCESLTSKNVRILVSSRARIPSWGKGRKGDILRKLCHRATHDLFGCVIATMPSNEAEVDASTVSGSRCMARGQLSQPSSRNCARVLMRPHAMHARRVFTPDGTIFNASSRADIAGPSNCNRQLRFPSPNPSLAFCPT